MGLRIAKPLDEILEKEWETTLFKSKEGLAPMLGWRLVYHTLRSKGSRAGFPDRVLVRDRVIFAESKREKKVASPISPEQREWLDGLARAGAEVYVWRPSDFEEIGLILSKRWQKAPGSSLLTLTTGRSEESWAPLSMWVPGVGRQERE